MLVRYITVVLDKYYEINSKKPLHMFEYYFVPFYLKFRAVRNGKKEHNETYFTFSSSCPVVNTQIHEIPDDTEFTV